MSISYKNYRISSCQIGGAVALAVLHDLHVNLSALSGVPQITVMPLEEGVFPVALTWEKRNGESRTVTFELEEKAAFNAAEMFKKEQKYDPSIFKVVQNAMAELEGIASNS